VIGYAKPSYNLIRGVALMTMTFEQIQSLIESNAKAIQAISEEGRQLRQELKETRAIVDSNARAIEANSNEITRLISSSVDTRTLVESNARAIEANSNEITRLISFSVDTRTPVESNARAIEANSNETANLREAAQSLFASQERLTTAYIGFTETVSLYIERTDRRLERLENAPA
jgi:chromosome segregation ATPase